MNAQTRICPPDIPDVDGRAVEVGAFLRDNGVLRVGMIGDNFSVYVTGDKHGTGPTFEDAFASALGVSEAHLIAQGLA